MATKATRSKRGAARRQASEKAAEKAAWWAFDIECASWDTFVHGCAIADDGRVVHMDDVTAVREWYLSLPSCDLVWAHNGGGYDFIFLIDVLRDLEWTARMAGSAIVSCRATGRAECRDSMRLFPGSLRKWTGGAKQDLGLPCACGYDCGGYCSITDRKSMSRAHLSRLIDYCATDCEALLRQLRADLERLESEGLAVIGSRGLPRLTFGSVAWHTAAAMTGLECRDARGIAAEERWRDYYAGRAGYYGGRTEVGRVRADAGHRYDVHAMYPWALTHPVPVGRRILVLGPDARRAYDAACPGVYRASVDVRDTDLPPLPHRYEGRSRDRGRLSSERLLWATGRLEGVWTHLELSNAEQHGDARILSIESAHVWSDFQPVYEPYMRHVYALRDAARRDGDDRWAALLKWYANALSGKLAQRPESAKIRVLPDSTPELLAPWDLVAGRVWACPTERLAPNCRPIEAAYLTARARCKLYDRLKRHAGRWIYCDTDSTYLVDADPTDVHESELGSWGYEGELSDWTALAPKLYRYRDECGKPRVRARGIPRPEWATIDELRRGETVTREVGVHRLRSGGGDFERRRVIRTHRDLGIDAAPVVDLSRVTERCGTRFVRADGTTRPLHRTDDGDYR